MNKSTKKLVAIVLMVSMLFSIVPATAFAAPAGVPDEVNGLQKFSSVEELVQAAQAKLQAEGKVYEAPVADKALVAAVESKSGKSFDEVKNAVSAGFYANYETGVMDTAAYNLSETEMDELLIWVLKEKQMEQDITYDFDVNEEGVVTAVNYEVAEGLDSAMAALTAMSKNEAETLATDSLLETTAEAVVEEQTVTEPISLFGLRSAEPVVTSSSAYVFPCDQALTTGSQVTFNFVPVNYPGDDTFKYDPATDSIGQAPSANWTYEVHSVSYVCSECGETHELPMNGENFGYGVVEVTVYADTETGAQYSLEKPVYYYGNPETGETTVYGDATLYVITGYDAYGNPQKEPVTEAVDNTNWMPAVSYAQAVVMAPVVADDMSTLIDGVYFYDVQYISGLQAMMAYEDLRALIKGKSELFGVSTPFWTEKTTEANPFGALKVVLNMEEDDQDATGVYAAYVPGLYEGYAALAVYYGDALLALANAAREVVNVGTAYDANRHITDEYKLLLLHDWLANNAIFDMGNLLKSRQDGQQADDSEGGVSLNDLVGMTPFTMLSDKIMQDGAGGVCLGYAASYTYIVQNAFADNYYVLKDGATGVTMADYVPKDDADVKHMVDFVKIRFNSNVAESSVAGGDSGFGDDTDRFTEPHFFNAAKVGSNWYYIDACYDDVNSEVISQHRVETEGNISHMYFLSSPETIEEQFEGNCDYIDSLYDGRTYVKPEDENYQQKVESGEIDAGWGWVNADDEKRYTDTTYEEAWFSNAVSEIILHEGNWYYVEGLNAYNSMKDMMGEENQDYMDQMKDQMQDQMNDPQYAHELKRRPISKNADLTGTQTTGEGQSMSMEEDKYAYGIYHYGYGYFDYEPGGVDENSGYEAVFAEDLKDDQAYRQMYPELSHGLGIYDGKLYFNISNKILCCDLGLIGSDEVPISQVKEYNDVYAVKDNNKLFEGMGFTLTDDKDAEYSFRYRPLAGLSIHDKFTMTETSVDMIPTMYVAVGTNLTESYGDPNYTTEALNYNPNYQRFMDDDKTDGENTNVEFMWCANLTEEMDMATLLSELTCGETEEVAVAAYCEKDAFTEQRTVNYGLSDGSTKTVSKNTALKHSYEWNQTEQVYVCKNCNHCTAERPSVLVGDINGDGKVSAKDYKLLKRAILEGTTSSLDLQYADINEDGTVSAKDYKLLKRQILSA